MSFSAGASAPREQLVALWSVGKHLTERRCACRLELQSTHRLSRELGRELLKHRCHGRKNFTYKSLFVQSNEKVHSRKWQFTTVCLVFWRSVEWRGSLGDLWQDLFYPKTHEDHKWNLNTILQSFINCPLPRARNINTENKFRSLILSLIKFLFSCTRK